MPDKEQFVVGDVVRLRSGGPAMTVSRVSLDRALAEAHTPDTVSIWVAGDGIECVWLTEGGPLQRATFPPGVLYSIDRFVPPEEFKDLLTMKDIRKRADELYKSDGIG